MLHTPDHVVYKFVLGVDPSRGTASLYLLQRQIRFNSDLVKVVSFPLTLVKEKIALPVFATSFAGSTSSWTNASHSISTG